MTQFRTLDIQLRMLSRLETMERQLHGLIIDFVQNCGHLAAHAQNTGKQIGRLHELIIDLVQNSRHLTRILSRQETIVRQSQHRNCAGLNQFLELGTFSCACSVLSRQETRSGNCTGFLFTQFRIRDIQLRMLSRQETRQTTTESAFDQILFELEACPVGRRQYLCTASDAIFNYFIFIDHCFSHPSDSTGNISSTMGYMSSLSYGTFHP